jgi:hypothetical protein
VKHCKCNCEQWAYADFGKGSPIIFCEVCDTEYRLDDLLEVYLDAHPEKCRELDLPKEKE